MSKQINVPADTETPDEKAAREAREAEALKAGEGVEIHHQNKTTGEVVNHVPSEGEPVARPENIPEKFWDADKGEVNLEALLKAQADAQAEVNRLRNATPAKEPEGQQQASNEGDNEGGEGDNTPSDSASAIEAARQEYANSGKLSDATYKSLADHGLDRNMVDGWIGNQEAAAQKLTDATYDAAGGEEAFNTMAEWAAENMPAEQVKAINSLLASSDADVVRQGASQLKAYYDANADIDPTTTISGEPNRSGGAAFQSRAEMTAAMRDPRYKNDAAFRAEVAMKIQRATAQGVDLFS